MTGTEGSSGRLEVVFPVGTGLVERRAGSCFVGKVGYSEGMVGHWRGTGGERIQTYLRWPGREMLQAAPADSDCSWGAP